MNSVCTAERHGSLDAYITYRCRCPESRRLINRAHKKYELRRQQGQRWLLDATGTHRRIQALYAVGWRAQDIAERIGWTPQGVTELRKRTYVYRPTAEAIARVYDELADHRGPSPITARRAKAKGWLVPLWWDDDTIDDPSYVPVTVEPDEQAAANRDARQQRRHEVARLTALGLSAAQIAARLGLRHDRQVVRDRQWLRGQQREAS